MRGFPSLEKEMSAYSWSIGCSIVDLIAFKRASDVVPIQTKTVSDTTAEGELEVLQLAVAVRNRLKDTQIGKSADTITMKSRLVCLTSESR